MAADPEMQSNVIFWTLKAQIADEEGKFVDGLQARFVANLFRITDLEQRVEQLECFIKNNWPPEAKNAQGT